ncbi:hypothetical protein H0Z60_08930 [Ectothiorhodospiraceae bacterium WFHF3C12]|nr:hypothetical protein [Ectothiorhodospiraceae bacterium WFHF3C12]
MVLLVGILAAVGASRFFGTQTYDERGFAGKAVSALRYAQKSAMAGRCEIRVNLDAAADSYTLSYTGNGPGNGTPGSCPASGTPVPRPGGGNYSETAASGVDVQGGVTLHYSSSGAATITGGSSTVPIGTFQLNIEPQSGLAYVQGF